MWRWKNLKVWTAAHIGENVYKKTFMLLVNYINHNNINVKFLTFCRFIALASNLTGDRELALWGQIKTQKHSKRGYLLEYIV